MEFLACPHRVSGVPSGRFWRTIHAHGGHIGDVPAGPVVTCPCDRRQGKQDACRVGKSRHKSAGVEEEETMLYRPVRRSPYGRALLSRRLVTELARRPARAFAEQLPMMTQPMPRGGVRLLVMCPRCDRCVAHLYNVLDLRERWMCRHCWRLSYPSEYLGRCPETDPPASRPCASSARRARSPAVRQRRERRAEEAQVQARRDARATYAYVARISRALAQAVRWRAERSVGAGPGAAGLMRTAFSDTFPRRLGADLACPTCDAASCCIRNAATR